MSGSKPLARDLAAQMPRGGRVITDPSVADPYLIDWRRYFRSRPAAIVLPVDTGEIQNIVRFCGRNKLRIVPQGGNTGLCGGASVQTDDTILLNLSRMTSIRRVSAEGRYVVADAGITIHQVNSAVAEHHLFLPIAFGAQESATLGGVISTNAGGINVLRYGNTRDQVLGLEVVLADGTVWDGLRALRKDNTGPDLKHLFIGTEGTLGIVASACMKLVPAEMHSVSVLLEAASPDAILLLANLAQQTGGERVSSFELISGYALRESCQRVLGIKPPLDGAGDWFALVRFAGALPVDALAETFAERAFTTNTVRDGVLSRSVAEEEKLWRIRHSFSELHRHLGPSSLRFDLGVPVDRVPELIDRLSGEYAPGAEVLLFGHMGDGNLHFSIFPDSVAASEDDHELALRTIVHQVVWELGGTISAEHGVGRLHVHELGAQKSAREILMAREIKNALDPAGILNPGVIFDQSSEADPASFPPEDH